MSGARRFLLFSGAFAAAKVLVVVAPLVASSSLSLGAYGRLEWALALGTALVPLAVLGLGAAVPYFVLHVRKADVAVAARAYGGVLALSGAGGAVACWFAELQLVALVAGLTAAFGAQMLVSAVHKAHGRVAVASFYDGGVYLCILLAAVSGVGGDDLSPYIALAVVYLLFLSTRSGMMQSWDGHGLKEALKYSVPLMVPAFAMLCLVNAGRAFGGYLLPAEEMGTYGVLFRITAPAILVHQILTTFHFRTIYPEGNARLLDRYYASIIVGVALVLSCLYPLAITVGKQLLPALRHATESPEFTCAYLWLAIQVTLWVGVALLESLMGRERLVASQTAVIGGVLTLLVCGIGLLAVTGNAKLHYIIGMQALAFGVVILLASARLRAAGIRLPATQWCTVALIAMMPAGFLIK